jgi:hypothetical protein
MPCFAVAAASSQFGHPAGQRLGIGEDLHASLGQARHARAFPDGGQRPARMAAIAAA